MYCEFRSEWVLLRLWNAHTEAFIRGAIGALGAVGGSLATLLIKHFATWR